MKKLITLLAAVILLLIVQGCSQELNLAPGEPLNHESIVAYEDNLNRILVNVVEVYDGDTLVVAPVSSNHKEIQNDHAPIPPTKGEYTVRLLLVDTPESTNTIMVGGKEASTYLKSLLEGKQAIIAYDSTGNTQDKFGRHLVYLELLDGTSVQEILLEQGLAVVRYINNPSSTFLDQFKAAESIAKENSLGVWSYDGYVIENGIESYYLQNYLLQEQAGGLLETSKEEGVEILADWADDQVEDSLDNVLGEEAGGIVDKLVGDRIEDAIKETLQ